MKDHEGAGEVVEGDADGSIQSSWEPVAHVHLARV